MSRVVAALIDAVSARPGRACAALALVALALFLPGILTLPPMDRDEPRFAQASKQMIETGDVVSIRFQDEARNKKPVGIYWLQASIVAAAEHLGFDRARDTIWLYRLASLAGAISAVLLTYWAALAVTDRRYAALAALLFAATLLIGVEARLAKTDAVLTATAAAALGALARAYLSGRAGGETRPPGLRLAVIFWTAIAAGLLVKGPITPMVAVLAGLGLVWQDRRAGETSRRWIGTLRPVAGVAWCLLLSAPWFALILLKTHGVFLADSLGHDMLGKVAGARESHGAPPGSYLLAFFVTGWPLAPLALLAAPFAWRARREPAVRLLLAWIVPSWIVFELVPTKLPHYVLPLYPAIAILVALAMQRGALAAARPIARGIAAGLVAFVPAAMLAAAVALAAVDHTHLGLRFFIGAPIVLIAALFAARQLWRDAWPPAGTGVSGNLVVGLALASFVLQALVYRQLLSGPFFEPFAMSPRLIAASNEALRGAPACPKLSLATVSYREPSLVFLAGTDLLMTSPGGAAAFLSGAPCRAAFIDAKEEDAFRAALPPNTPIRLATRVAGVRLNGGAKLDIGVYVRGGEGS